MNKRTLRILAILLIVLGVAYIVIGCKGIEDAKPSTFTTGYEIDGKYVQTGTGKIGGNKKQKADMEMIRNMGILFLGCGGCTLIGSIAMKPGDVIKFK